jgi:hypothetical protein
VPNAINQNVSIEEENVSEIEPPAIRLITNNLKINLSEDEGALLIISNAKKIWENLFLMRKQLLEDSLKIKFSSASTAYESNADIADLKKVKSNIYEICLKTWQGFIENERQIRILKAKCKQNLVQTRSLGIGNLQNTSLDSQNNFTLNNFAAVGERLTNINKLSKVVGSGAGLMSKLVINTVSSTIKKDSFKSSSSISLDQQASQNKQQIAIPIWKLMDKNQVIKITELHVNLIMETIQFNYKNKILLVYNN